jgi:hypothetical protein
MLTRSWPTLLTAFLDLEVFIPWSYVVCGSETGEVGQKDASRDTFSHKHNVKMWRVAPVSLFWPSEHPQNSFSCCCPSFESTSLKHISTSFSGSEHLSQLQNRHVPHPRLRLGFSASSWYFWLRISVRSLIMISWTWSSGTRIRCQHPTFELACLASYVMSCGHRHKCGTT